MLLDDQYTHSSFAAATMGKRELLARVNENTVSRQGHIRTKWDRNIVALLNPSESSHTNCSYGRPFSRSEQTKEILQHYILRPSQLLPCFCLLLGTRLTK